MYEIKVYDEQMALIAQHPLDHTEANARQLAEQYALQMNATLLSLDTSSDCIYIVKFSNDRTLGFSI